MEDELNCEVCGAKLTGEEGMMICMPCQQESEEYNLEEEDNSLLDDCPLKDLLSFLKDLQ